MFEKFKEWIFCLFSGDEIDIITVEGNIIKDKESKELYIVVDVTDDSEFLCVNKNEINKMFMYRDKDKIWEPVGTLATADHEALINARDRKFGGLAEDDSDLLPITPLVLTPSSSHSDTSSSGRD